MIDLLMWLHFLQEVGINGIISSEQIPIVVGWVLDQLSLENLASYVFNHLVLCIYNLNNVPKLLLTVWIYTLLLVF